MGASLGESSALRRSGYYLRNGSRLSRVKIGDAVCPIFYPNWLEGSVADESMVHAPSDATADGVLVSMCRTSGHIGEEDVKSARDQPGQSGYPFFSCSAA